MDANYTVKEKIDKAPSIKIPIWCPKDFFVKSLKEMNSFTAIMIGSRHSGKSNMLKNFLINSEGGNLCKKFDMVVVFSKTLVNGYYQKFLKTKLLFEEFNPEIIDALKQTFAEQKKAGKKFRFLILFDDCLQGMKYQNAIENFFYNSRHYGGSCIFLSQKASMVSQNWKNNTDLFVILGAGSGKEKRYLAEDVVADAIEEQMPISKPGHVVAIAKKILNEVVQDYNALIITPFCKNDKIKQYTAPRMRK